MTDPTGTHKAPVSEADVLEALRAVPGPDGSGNLVDLGMVGGLVVKQGNVGFALEVDRAKAAEMEPLRKRAEAAVDAVPGVLSVTAVLTAHNAGPSGGGAQEPSAGQGAAGPGTRGAAPGGRASATVAPPGVKHIIAVASGKGGVGKSTTAVNLTLAMAAAGRRVGLLDADIYGPSQPRMLGISGRPRTDKEGRTLIPMENHGVVCMSMGFLVDEETPMIWRGPMVMGALQQMLRDVAWGELDVLVVDMPPGTGDAQLTLAQQVSMAGAVIVSTPQDIALLDARKGLNMFRKVDVPVLGIVENMSMFICPKCGHESHIFGHDGARQEADRLGVDFLGAIPLDIRIRETSDDGTPIVVADPESPQARAFREVADRVLAKLDAEARPKGPRIVVQ